MIFNSTDQIIFQLQLIKLPARMSKGGALFQNPFPLIYSVHWDFNPNFVICCTTFSLSGFQVHLL